MKPNVLLHAVRIWLCNYPCALCHACPEVVSNPISYPEQQLAHRASNPIKKHQCAAPQNRALKLQILKAMSFKERKFFAFSKFSSCFFFKF